jgi:hypothetical protein
MLQILGQVSRTLNCHPGNQPRERFAADQSLLAPYATIHRGRVKLRNRLFVMVSTAAESGCT